MTLICCSISGRTAAGGFIASSAAKRARASGRFPCRAATIPPRNSALPDCGSSNSARSMSRAARLSSSLSSESARASASPSSASALRPPLRRSARANAAYRQRVLLQHGVGASEHQPAVEILWVVLELARQAPHHGLRRIGRRRGAPGPVAPAQVQHRRTRHQQCGHSERRPGCRGDAGAARAQQRHRHQRYCGERQCRGQQREGDHQPGGSSSTG